MIRFAATTLLLASSALAQTTRPLLRGQDAMTDWRSDAPGVRRIIRVDDLPHPNHTRSVDNGPKLVPRPAGALPQVPSGFVVSMIAEELSGPRKIATAPNGDILVAESYAGRIRLLRLNQNGEVAQNSIFAERLNRPFGIAFYPPGDDPRWLYVANTGSVVRFPYTNGNLKAAAKPETIISSISAGGQLRGGGHWTRDIVFSADGKRMFVSVGSRSNNSDDAGEISRACILSYAPDGSEFRTFATGLRNPVGLAIEPVTGSLWASINERDGLGDDLPPDYITSIRENGFYGWPWFYIGAHEDPDHRGKRTQLAPRVIVPDVLVQAHSASLCMTFYTGATFPNEFYGDAFAAEHGSWNRSKRTGYKVIRVPLRDGCASGEYEDFLTGFVTPDGDVWGRPVGVTVAKDGALIVSEDGNNTIWRIQYVGR